MRKALAILGDKWHAPAVIYRAIGTMLESNGFLVDCVFDYNIPFAFLNQYSLIVLSRYALDDRKDNRTTENLWITPEQEDQIREFVMNGGRILLHHDGISHYPKSGGICQLAKAFRISHPPIEKITIIPVGNENGINLGVSSFEIEDEEFIMDFKKNETTVFLLSQSNKYGKCPQAWFHSYGNGKVLVFIPGHEDVNLRNHMLMRSLQNSLEWLIK